MKIMIPDPARTALPVCGHNAARKGARHADRSSNQETHMWTKPEYTEMRFGFEVTMYIASR